MTSAAITPSLKSRLIFFFCLVSGISSIQAYRACSSSSLMLAILSSKKLSIFTKSARLDPLELVLRPRVFVVTTTTNVVTTPYSNHANKPRPHCITRKEVGLMLAKPVCIPFHVYKGGWSIDKPSFPFPSSKVSRGL